MARSKNREDCRQFSVSFPMHIVEEIDTICKVNYHSRSNWLFTAAKEKLERDRTKRIEKIKNEVKLD